MTSVAEEFSEWSISKGIALNAFQSLWSEVTS